MFKQKEKLQLIINEGNKFEDKFSNNYFLQQLAYLVDMFEHLNIFDLKLQGPEMTVLQLLYVINAFTHKLENWKHKTEGEAYFRSCLSYSVLNR